MVTVVVFEFGVMRCQPLRRALYRFNVKSRQKTASNVITESLSTALLILFPASANTWIITVWCFIKGNSFGLM